MKIRIILTLYVLLAFLSKPLLSKSERCHPKDREILLKIKAAFRNPYTLASWIPGTDCCEWYVSKCDENTNRIIEIDLNYAEVSTQIPEAIAELPYLESLTLRKLSNLTGPIPSFLTKIPRLKSLWISWTNVSGPIPSFLGEIKTLTFLDLSFNNLSGSIPQSLGQLTNLYALRLDRNRLTGSIPEWFGRFPFMYLSHNQLTGTIPRSWGNFNFSVVQLQRNKLEGDISVFLGKNKSISQLDVSRNMLVFDMSKLEFPESSNNIDFNHNRIYGSLPKGLIKLQSLYLNVSYNRLCGKIPVGGRMQEFGVDAYFHNRCLCGAPLPNTCK